MGANNWMETRLRDFSRSWAHQGSQVSIDGGKQLNGNLLVAMYRVPLYSNEMSPLMGANNWMETSLEFSSTGCFITPSLHWWGQTIEWKLRVRFKLAWVQFERLHWWGQTIEWKLILWCDEFTLNRRESPLMGANNWMETVLFREWPILATNVSIDGGKQLNGNELFPKEVSDRGIIRSPLMGANNWMETI